MSARRTHPHEQDGELRLGTIVLMVALALGTPAALYFGGYAIANSRLFLVHEVAISGNAQVTEREILVAADLLRPRNVLSCRAERIERAVEALPWVREAEVAVRLRGEVHIDVVEAQLDVIVAAGDLYLVDTQGDVIRRWQPGDVVQAPLLLGVATAGESGPRIDREALAQARAVRDAFAASESATRTAIAELHYQVLHGFRLVLDDGTEVRVGSDRFVERFARLDRTLEVLEREGQQPAYVMLDGRNLDRVAVRLHDRSSPLTAAPAR